MDSVWHIHIVAFPQLAKLWKAHQPSILSQCMWTSSSMAAWTVPSLSEHPPNNVHQSARERMFPLNVHFASCYWSKSTILIIRCPQMDTHKWRPVYCLRKLSEALWFQRIGVHPKSPMNAFQREWQLDFKRVAFIEKSFERNFKKFNCPPIWWHQNTVDF